MDWWINFWNARDERETFLCWEAEFKSNAITLKVTFFQLVSSYLAWLITFKSLGISTPQQIDDVVLLQSHRKLLSCCIKYYDSAKYGRRVKTIRLCKHNAFLKSSEWLLCEHYIHREDHFFFNTVWSTHHSKQICDVPEESHTWLGETADATNTTKTVPLMTANLIMDVKHFRYV